MVDEAFISALAGLISVVGQNISLEIELLDNGIFKNFKIKKTYGDMWQQLIAGKKYKI